MTTSLAILIGLAIPSAIIISVLLSNRKVKFAILSIVIAFAICFTPWFFVSQSEVEAGQTSDEIATLLKGMFWTEYAPVASNLTNIQEVDKVFAFTWTDNDDNKMTTLLVGTTWVQLGTVIENNGEE